MLLAWFCHEAAHWLAGKLQKTSVQVGYTWFGLPNIQTDAGCLGRRECLVAAAGPAMNLLLAYGSYHLAREAVFFHYFYETNLVLAFINCLPMLPLDGAKVLRGWFSKYINWLSLTRGLAYLGQVMAIAFAGCILYFGLNHWLLILAVAVYGLAYLEEKNSIYLLTQNLLQTSCQKKKSHRRLRLPAEATVGQAVLKLSPGYENLIYLQGQPNKRITETRLLTAWQNGQGYLLLGQIS